MKVENFISKLFDPLSLAEPKNRESKFRNEQEQRIYLAASITLGIFTFGISHACYFSANACGCCSDIASSAENRLNEERTTEMPNGERVSTLTTTINHLTTTQEENAPTSEVKMAPPEGIAIHRELLQQITTEKKYAVRDVTALETKSLLRKDQLLLEEPFDPNELDEAVKEDLTKTYLIKDPKSYYINDRCLGSRDILYMPCQMHYGADWEKKEDNSPSFMLYHAAAPNLSNQFGFQRFQNSEGSLDAPAYIEEMGAIATNVMKIAEGELVWFPFGIGAFLRNLKDHDTAYGNRHNMQQLRIQVAEATINAWATTLINRNNLNIHLCLPWIEGNQEAIDNHNAYVFALQNLPEQVRNRVVIYENWDATALASELAKTHTNVAMLNGANRARIGNCWFGNGALTAIDENLFRRAAPRTAAVAAVLNSGRNNSFETNVIAYGGSCIRLTA